MGLASGTLHYLFNYYKLSKAGRTLFQSHQAEHLSKAIVICSDRVWNQAINVGKYTIRYQSFAPSPSSAFGCLAFFVVLGSILTIFLQFVVQHLQILLHVGS